MKTNVNSIPKGYHSLTPYITVKDAKKAIEFYQKAFGAKEIERMPMPDGSIGHAVLEIGDSRIMLADENLEWGNKGPQTLGGTPVGLCLYVDDVDTVFNNALTAGATVVGDMVVKDQFYGDRSGTVADPFGCTWMIGTHKRDVSQDEMQKLMNQMYESQRTAQHN